MGFIRDLPHKLVEAFEATLHEAADADLLLHVIDAASPHLAEQQADVERVLEEIGAAGVPQLLVYNKCDLLDPSLQQELLEGLRDANVRQLFEDLDPDDRARLTEAQYASYKAGNLYLNVHSARHPGGEVRAQITGR